MRARRIAAIAALGATALAPFGVGEASADVGDSYYREDRYTVGSVTCTIRGQNDHVEISEAWVSARVSGPGACRDGEVRMSVYYRNFSGSGVSFVTTGRGFVSAVLYEVESDIHIQYQALHEVDGTFVGSGLYSLPK
jgi:hypothetical protein